MPPDSLPASARGRAVVTGASGGLGEAVARPRAARRIRTALPGAGLPLPARVLRRSRAVPEGAAHR
ncbi:hypothetical protein CLV72_102137 [Allonocardiopsis opalescens]|uniref:Uncharacterized protein n=1 Tax=Allonocardiopsis opalescens TaxID=1144618 RepID=A0A2T0Q9D7_9ACTN|nr:hypothetical protein CLV72_102137 [Allonocardiopsis opalescens]